MNFTPEEQELITYFARLESRKHRIGFYAAMITPILAFGLYGLFRADIIALGLAFAGALLVLAWLICASSRHSRIFASIFGKLAQAQAGPIQDAPRD